MYTMEVEEKNNLVKDILECIGEAVNIDSDDSDKEDLLMGLTNLCKKATLLPTNNNKRQWIKPWRKQRNVRGSFSFLTTELLLTDEASYTNYLRMSKEQFTFILNLIEEDITRCDTRLRNAISPAEKLAVTMRFLATGESFRSLNYQTRMGTSTISTIVPEVCRFIAMRMQDEYLKFPSGPSEWEAIAKEFAVKWQFPNCLGALDGKHIAFRPPRKDGAFYHNYKGGNSIILMALADANYKFIFVDIGCNGRSNDAGVFLQSNLKTVLENEEEMPPKTVVGNGRLLPYVVVADDAFPMQTYMMKPYPYHTTVKEKQVFNARLSRARHVVEQSFGILANRFRVFLSPMNLKVETVEAITLACCVLHNFLLKNDEHYLTSAEPLSASSDALYNIDSVYNPRKGAAEALRQQFSEYFSKEGKLDWI